MSGFLIYCVLRQKQFDWLKSWDNSGFIQLDWKSVKTAQLRQNMITDKFSNLKMNSTHNVLVWKSCEQTDQDIMLFLSVYCNLLSSTLLWIFLHACIHTSYKDGWYTFGVLLYIFFWCVICQRNWIRNNYVKIPGWLDLIKFILSKKATKIDEIFTDDLM